jgi:hypothetical protein
MTSTLKFQAALALSAVAQLGLVRYRVQLWRKNQNRLWIVFWGLLFALPFWIVYWREWHGAGIGVIIADLLFIVLYLRHSYYAWHIAFIINIWLPLYHLAVGRHPRIDIVIGAVILVYLLLARDAYREHTRAHAFYKEI